jgi:hypothetical protein
VTFRVDEQPTCFTNSSDITHYYTSHNAETVIENSLCDQAAPSKQDMATSTRPIQRSRNDLDFLDFSKSQVSSTYAHVLLNTFCRAKVRVWHRDENRHQDYGLDQVFKFSSPRHRKKPFVGKLKGLDSNLASRSGAVPAVDCSSRGFRISDWTMHKVDSESDVPGPRKGMLKRRSIPASEDRMYFPTLIREDKREQRWLMRRTRKTKVKMLLEQQIQHYTNKLEKEEAKLDKVREEAEREEEDREKEGKRKRMFEKVQNSIERSKRKKLVIHMAEDVLK